jgi:cyclopropane-fatty-acyl-phospholipid synthase
MKYALSLAEKGLVPDALIRAGIRKLLRHRLEEINPGNCEERSKLLSRFLQQMRESPIALHTQEANDQHYELPPAFFEKVLGKHLKYSSCYYANGDESLDQAEAAMLELYGERAELAEGQDILELGCGWGSLTLWMAERYRNSRITAVSNSAPQRHFINARCAERGLDNVEVITCDMNEFRAEGHYDRIVSVEMFEHLRNYRAMLQRANSWLKDDGKLFIHIFVHSRHPYLFEVKSEDDWMSKYFFTGGMMPSDDLLHYLQEDLSLESHWRVSGSHYGRTARHWLEKLDAQRSEILQIFAKTYGADKSGIWLERWRMFFMSCEELFGFDDGQEWWVAHYLMAKRPVISRPDDSHEDQLALAV